jgi:dipeptidyl aminopeptidase/acylaminoacyl peptidase
MRPGQPITFLTCLGLGLLAGPLAAAAQGSAEDYQRASELRAKYAGRLAGDRVEPIWLAGGKLMYSLAATGGSSQLVMIDPSAPNGQRRSSLTEIEALAAAFAKAGVELFAAAAGADGAVQLLFEDGQALRFDPSDHSVRPLALQDADGLLLEPNERRGGRRGARARTSILFVNQTKQALELFWVSGAGPGRSYGFVEAGQVRRISTFNGDVWRITARLGNGNAGPDGAAPEATFRGRTTPGAVLLNEETWSSSRARPRNDRVPPQSRPSGERSAESSSGVQIELRDGNLFARGKRAEARPDSAEADPAEAAFEWVAWTNDGSPADSYATRLNWAPGRRAFAVTQTRAAPSQRQVHLIESSLDDQLQPKLHSFDYTKPGDVLDYARPKVYRLDDDGQTIAVPIDEAMIGTPWRINQQSWTEDGTRFRFLVNQRGHQALSYYELDVTTGQLRALIDERSASFIDYSSKTYLRVLPDGERAIWMSERSGWNHLYLVDLETTKATPLTSGEWVVRSVEDFDAATGRLQIRVMGYYPDQDPYHEHFASVDLETGKLTMLTEGDGTHQLDWSPDGSYFVDRYSRVDFPPVTELRTADGQLVCELERADAAPLLAKGWRAPQRFAAKGRDGSTDIWGVVYRPSNFDPAKKYPVIENIYAGPHDAHVPKSWAVHSKSMEMAELGFLVVRIDGMGTNWRSKAFHDVAWKNIGDAGFPDRKAWIRAFAATEPAADLSRVGIYGGSAGGQNAMRALIDHHDFYHAAVADCGCHDNRMDKIWWNEAWMGWPIDESYAKSSNVDHAHRMQGDLLLVVGELDRNVDPASTMQVVDALIQADKDFELLVVPGGGHGIAESSYGTRRRRDFFVRHLLGVEPRWQPIASER